MRKIISLQTSQMMIHSTLRKIILIALVILTNTASGHETETYQSDSIYRANNVKARLWYSGTNKQLGITTFYDRNGRMVKYQLEPFVDGAQRTTHYTYDSDGKLMSMVDTTQNLEPNKEQIKILKTMGMDPDKIIKKSKNRPPVEISRYELTYSGDRLVKITHYNSDGSLDIVDNISEDGKTEIRDWYRGGSRYEQSTTVFLTRFHKEKFFGWQIMDGQKIKWDYTFKYEFENGRVKNYVRYDGKKEIDTTRYFYDGKGLLTRMDGDSPEVFEYVYY